MLNFFLEDKKRILIFYILLRYSISIINNMLVSDYKILKNCGNNYYANINDCSKEGKENGACLPNCYFTFGVTSRQFLIIFLSIASLIYNKYFIVLLPIFFIESGQTLLYKLTGILFQGEIDYTSIFSIIEIFIIPFCIYFKILD